MPQYILVLDAMGVMYSAADDVAELLVPFIRDYGGIADADEISRNYVRASLGEIDGDAFWRSVGVSPELEREYLARHRLVDGLLDFLSKLPPSVCGVWCLSNDVGRWSCALRTAFELEQFFDGFVISSDIGARKPSPAIYEALLERTGIPAASHVFIDDRPKNLAAAATLGLRVLQYDAGGGDQDQSREHTRVASFPALWDYLNAMDD